MAPGSDLLAACLQASAKLNALFWTVILWIAHLDSGLLTAPETTLRVKANNESRIRNEVDKSFKPQLHAQATRLERRPDLRLFALGQLQHGRPHAPTDLPELESPAEDVPQEAAEQ